ncbi:MAG TPA: HTTM domain-containing protein, partial [Actinomycetota bacterium]|nr:HTTM domain-containing protein [Actinomycetota bacterium]
SRLPDGIHRWLFEPAPRARVAVFRAVVYSFIFVDVLLTTSWIAGHGDLPGELYHPLWLGRVLHLPTPTPLLVAIIQWGLLGAAVAVFGKAPRVMGAAVALLYLWWMLIGFSYGKVDHDRVAFLVALAVLPTVGPAGPHDAQDDAAAGWALRCIQIAVVLTYFLAAFAKFRFGGLEWLTGATLTRAVIRRGTWLASPLAEYPVLLQAFQYLIVLFELSSPLLLARGRIGRVFLGGAFAFHVLTYASITIIFLPHVVCLLAFLPLERIPERMRRMRLRTA